jgi:glycosyltransferase involved in cell wall biosynthesis
VRILALPRDANPYQERLYAEVRRLGTPVAYLGDLTPSRTLNLLLLPFETAARSAMGWRVVHVHWLFGFALPGGGRLPVLRRLSQWWFNVWLRTARWARVEIVWTAHNALPHGRLLHDDAAARRALVRASSLVIAHTPHTLGQLAVMGAQPRRAAIVPHGPLSLGPTDAHRRPGSSPGPRRLLFFGQVLEYKGVEDLVAATALMPTDVSFRLTVAGRCPDPELRRRLEDAARRDDRVTLDLRHVPDDEAARLLDEADALVLPFRRITTSGTLHLALAHGRPVVIPDLPALADVPAGAAERYDGSVHGLTEAMRAICDAPAEQLAAMADAAGGHDQAGWDTIAERTLAAIGPRNAS